MATAGQLLSNTLRLERQLGSGAMGEVWVAHHASLGSEVAVKLLTHLGDPALRARFLQEARGLGQLSSPYIVRVFDVGESPEQQPFIVMEWLRGVSLHQRIESGGALSLEDTVTVVSQLARALTHAHERGVVHRDIKPANLFLVDAAGAIHLQVLDFGIAKYAGAADLGMTTTGTMMGTPYYMSPEQLLDPKSVDHRADLWATSVVAYACITGTVPFSGETLGALSVAIHTGAYAPPSQYRAGLPQAVEDWFVRAFHRDLALRFQSAAELAEAFAAAARGAPVEGHVASQPAPRSFSPVSMALEPTGAHAPAVMPSLASPPQPALPLTTHGGSSLAMTGPAPSRGVPAWLAALLGVVALVALAALGWVATSSSSATPAETTADEEDGGADEPPAKKSSKKKKKASEPPRLAMSSFDLKKHFGQLEAAAKKSRTSVDLVYLSLLDVPPTGILDDDSLVTAVFRARGTTVCVFVSPSGDGAWVASEGTCDEHASQPLRPPRCSQTVVVARAVKQLPKSKMTLTFMRLGGTEPSWSVLSNASEDVAFIADDC